jgi:hypothetical protein
MTRTVSTSAGHKAGDRSANGRIASAPARLESRRFGRAAIAVAGLLVIVSAVAVCGLVLYARGGTAYLAVARPVAFGQPITAADLTTVRLAPGSVLTPIPASEQNTVVGSAAARPLEPGDLLTRAAVASGPVIAAGKRVVAVPLKAGQAPARPLAPMTKVQLVELPADTGGPAQQPGSGRQPALPTAEGVVLSVKELDYGAGVVADVIVDQAAAVNLAAAAAAGRVALVVNGGGS